MAGLLVFLKPNLALCAIILQFLRSTPLSLVVVYKQEFESQLIPLFELGEALIQ